MGQYYMPAMIHDDGRIETICSHDFGCGLKLMEHSWIGNDFVNAVYAHIHNRPLRIAWIGDYSNEFDSENPENYHEGMTLKEFTVFYDSVWGEEPNQIPKAKFSDAEHNLVDDDTAEGYLVNRDIGAYLDIGKYIKRATVQEGGDAGYCVNPLPLLTACGNDRGGGDFHLERAKSGYDQVGLWAFDRLEYTEIKPMDLAEVEYTFIET